MGKAIRKVKIMMMTNKTKEMPERKKFIDQQTIGFVTFSYYFELLCNI